MTERNYFDPPSNDVRLLIAAVKDGLHEIAKAIRETNHDSSTYCTSCNSSTHNTLDHHCLYCNEYGHEDKYDEECEHYKVPKPYTCPECGMQESYRHMDGCSFPGASTFFVTRPPLRASFPSVSTERGGIQFSAPITTPGAPPPELPEELNEIRSSYLTQPLRPLNLNPVPDPKVKVGDVITYQDRKFTVTHVGINNQYEVTPTDDIADLPPGADEGELGTWSHCGVTEPHTPHSHTVTQNEGSYPGVICQGTSNPLRPPDVPRGEARVLEVDETSTPRVIRMEKQICATCGFYTDTPNHTLGCTIA